MTEHDVPTYFFHNISLKLPTFLMMKTPPSLTIVIAKYIHGSVRRCCVVVVIKTAVTDLVGGPLVLITHFLLPNLLTLLRATRMSGLSN